MAILSKICLAQTLLMVSLSYVASAEQQMLDPEYNQWLKDEFGAVHQALIPVVTVADIFYSCNVKRNIDKNNYSIKQLVLQMDRDLLAEKLSLCLADNSINSDVAINYGLQGCFQDQLADLPEAERKQKMKLVLRAIASLSKEERLKSLTQCVTDQAINYLPRKSAKSDL